MLFKENAEKIKCLKEEEVNALLFKVKENYTLKKK